jgi:hypothetical protein
LVVNILVNNQILIIEDINSILSFGEFDQYDDNDSNNIIINKQSLLSELTKYRNVKLVIKFLEQKQIQLINNIKEFENQKLILENYTKYLFILLSNLTEIQVLLNKVNIALEEPKSLFIFLCYVSFSKDGEKDNDSPN